MVTGLVNRSVTARGVEGGHRTPGAVLQVCACLCVPSRAYGRVSMPRVCSECGQYAPPARGVFVAVNGMDGTGIHAMASWCCCYPDGTGEAVVRVRTGKQVSMPEHGKTARCVATKAHHAVLVYAIMVYPPHQPSSMQTSSRHGTRHTAARGPSTD